MSSKLNYFSYRYSLIFLIVFNIFLLRYFKVTLFDQLLNLMISFGVFNYYERNEFKENSNSIFINLY